MKRDPKTGDEAGHLGTQGILCSRPQIQALRMEYAASRLYLGRTFSEARSISLGTQRGRSSVNVEPCPLR